MGNVFTQLAALPLTPALGVQLIEISEELSQSVGESPFEASLTEGLRAGDLRAIREGKSRLGTRLQELREAPNGGKALSRFAVRIRTLRKTGSIFIPACSVKELVAKHLREGILFEQFRLQIDPDELSRLQTKGWDAVWEEMRPEHFIEVWIKVMGNLLVAASVEDADPQDRRAVHELLSLALTAKQHHYPINDADLERFEELMAMAMRVVRNRPTKIGRPGSESAETPLLVDRYFAPGTREREWFDIEWEKEEHRGEGKEPWERLNAVVADRLRHADQLPFYLGMLFEQHRDASGEELIRRSRAKVEALLGLIRALNALGRLHLLREEERMVEDLEHTFNKP